MRRKSGFFARGPGFACVFTPSLMAWMPSAVTNLLPLATFTAGIRSALFVTSFATTKARVYGGLMIPRSNRLGVPFVSK